MTDTPVTRPDLDALIARLNRDMSVPGALSIRAEAFGDIRQVITALAAERARADRAEATRDALFLVIEQAKRVPDRDEVVPISDPVRRHAYIKGGEVRAERFREVLSTAPAAEQGF